MTELQDIELSRIQALLERSAEFIAYFEFAEAEVQKWTEQIEAQQQALHQLLSSTETGSVYESMRTLHKDISLLNAQSEEAHLSYLALMRQQISTFEALSAQSLKQLEQRLARYDVSRFHRLADESCHRMNSLAHESVQKNKKMFKYFQRRFFISLTILRLLIPLASAFYINDEWPWDSRQNAKRQREAGQLLLSAWPSLSQSERIKILKQETS